MGLISGVVGLGASVFGGIKASKQRKKMDRFLNQQDADNKAWYNANALSDYTQRSDTQNLMKQLRETMGKENKIAANTAVVTGGMPEQQAVQKEQTNKVISDTFSNIGAMGQQWKDGITNQYLQRKDNIAQQRLGGMEGQAQSYENLMSSGVNMLSGSLGSIGSTIKDALPAGGATKGVTKLLGML